ncbi:MAG: hypothetical protein AB7P40_20245 [Chloroflexota bacterium]
MSHRTQRIKKVGKPTTVSRQSRGGPLDVPDKDVIDFIVMTVAIFTIFYLGSLVQRMGAV